MTVEPTTPREDVTDYFRLIDCGITCPSSLQAFTGCIRRERGKRHYDAFCRERAIELGLREGKTREAATDLVNESDNLVEAARYAAAFAV